MPEITKHPPSTFCWLELGTTDQAAAKKFYSELMGWTTEDMPMGEGATYTFLKLRGKEVAALYQLGAEERKQGAPPAWRSYVAVESADAATKKARELGAKVIMDAFDVMDVGRMAVLQDPTGAFIQVWEPKKHTGAAIINETWAPVWSELSTKDPDAAGRFYSQWFGWKPQNMDMGGGMTYTVFQLGERGIAGMMKSPAPDMPSFWMPYYAVPDCDQLAKKAAQLGGKVLVQPTDIPRTGRFAVIQDPQGATFGILKPEPM